MQKKVKFLIVLLCCLISSSAIAQQLMRSVSKQEAFSIVKSYFSGQDVDYYYCDRPVSEVTDKDRNIYVSQNNTWEFFVDAEPLKGWEHDCYIVRVVKQIRVNLFPTAQTEKFRLPPKGNFLPLEVKNRYGVKANLKPYVKKKNLSNEVKSAARHTYAVILSGGHSPFSNYERYWNDCSFVYQTLVNKYGVPKNNIAVVMSDGTDPAADMHTTTGNYKSSPLDLDYDGLPDIQYAATRANVKNVLSNFSQRIGKDDHLFFYVIDHGGTRDNKDQSYICLWNGESLHDYELADWLRPFNEKQVYVNAVLGQCFSGGFVEELTNVGCVVATASESDKSSYGCYDIPYDEFVYHWTSAINGEDAYGNIVSSDVDNNNRVTMEEAFTYAKQKDRAPEAPQYKSNPTSIGEDLAFNNLPEAVDLYIKDNAEDTGKEPNTSTDIFWNSPDIWVRNQKDTIKIHENPYYSDNHMACLVHVRVHNRGKKDFNGEGKWVHVYWAQASTGLTIKAWKGRELYENHISGDHIRAVSIPYIPAGKDGEVFITWGIQEDMVHYQSDNGTEKHHYCLIARILDSPYDDSYDPKESYFNVIGDNNIAQKNVSIVSRRELSKGISVFVRNIYGNNHTYSLELQAPTEKDKLLFSKANVKMKMAKPIYKAWKRGGLRATDIVYNPTASPYSVKLNSSNSRLENICMNGAEFEKVTMNFDFHTPSTDPNEKYTFDLIQKDENGNIVGGETFIVEAPLHSHKGIEITPIDLGDGKYKLSTDWQETDRILWTDAVGSDVGTGNNITVTPTLTNNKFSAIGISSQGEMAQESVTLESKTGFKSISPTPVEDFIDIELHNPIKTENAVLRINSLTQTGSILLSKHIPLDVKKIQFDVTSLPSGIYVLTYSVDNQIVDSRKFSKK